MIWWEEYLTRIGMALSGDELKFLFNVNTVPIKIVGIVKCLAGVLRNNGESQPEVSKMVSKPPSPEKKLDYVSGLLQDPTRGELIKDKVV